MLCNAGMALKRMGSNDSRERTVTLRKNEKRLGIYHLGMRFIEEKLAKDFYLSIVCSNPDSLNLK
jgi:hypothetical protein